MVAGWEEGGGRGRHQAKGKKESVERRRVNLALRSKHRRASINNIARKASLCHMGGEEQPGANAQVAHRENKRKSGGASK